MTLALDHPSSFRSQLHIGSPALHGLALAFAAAFVLCSLAGLIDERLLNGVSVWEKPAKFYLSLSVHAATLAWGMSLLPQAVRDMKSVRRSASAFAIISVLEMAWVTLQGARGAASHFNQTDPLAMAMYPLMGIGAVTMTVITVYLGWRILRSGKDEMAYAAGIGFILSGTLTTIVAGWMSSGTGHSVGGDLTDASGLAFFHWSTTGGDYRVSHFAALHIAQALPFLAWIWPDRRIVTFGAILSVIVVAALFVQAMSGVPFLQA